MTALNYCCSGVVSGVLYSLCGERTGSSADGQHMHEPSQVAGISERGDAAPETSLRH